MFILKDFHSEKDLDEPNYFDIEPYTGKTFRARIGLTRSSSLESTKYNLFHPNLMTVPIYPLVHVVKTAEITETASDEFYGEVTERFMLLDAIEYYSWFGALISCGLLFCYLISVYLVAPYWKSRKETHTIWKTRNIEKASTFYRNQRQEELKLGGYSTSFVYGER